MAVGDDVTPFELTFEIFDLPKLPNQLLGSHWRVRSSHKKKWLAVIRKSIWPLVPKHPLTQAALTLTRHSSVRPDNDNLAGSFKAVVDCLTDLGVIIDDNPDVIGMPSYLWKPASPGNGKITVEVRGEYDLPSL